MQTKIKIFQLKFGHTAKQTESHMSRLNKHKSFLTKAKLRSALNSSLKDLNDVYPTKEDINKLGCISISQKPIQVLHIRARKKPSGISIPIPRILSRPNSESPKPEPVNQLNRARSMHAKHRAKRPMLWPSFMINR